MNIPKLSKKQVVLVATAILLVVTNPSPRTTRDALGIGRKVELRRYFNLFVCSIYMKPTTDDKGRDCRKYYLGMLGNTFFVLRTYDKRHWLPTHPPKLPTRPPTSPSEYEEFDSE